MQDAASIEPLQAVQQQLPPHLQRQPVHTRTATQQFPTPTSLLRFLLQAEVRTLERVSERMKDGIRDIDARTTRISQTATRVGDRLQVSWPCKQQQATNSSSTGSSTPNNSTR